MIALYRRAAGVVSLLCVGIGTAYAGDTEATLRMFLAETNVVTANFEQELRDANGQVVEVSYGSLLIARPNRLRWDYTEPDQVVMADGERLWLFDREVDQVTISDQADSIAGSPAALLAGDAAALDEFRVTRSFREAGLDWLELQPVREDGDFSRIRIAFDGDSLAAMELADQLEQRTQIRFADVATNVAIDDGRFTLDIPDYVDVVDNSTSAADSNEPQ
ncbi:MAG: outer membrane lipoprotein chaperone LolA [Pseudomonadota bacterium]